PLSDLHHLPFALALIVVLVGVVPWIILSGLRTILGKVGSTAAVEASIITIPTIELWGIRPLARLLLLLLLRHWRSESSLLPRRPKNKSARWGHFSVEVWVECSAPDDT